MEDIIILDPREEALRDKISALVAEFLKGGYYLRLVMTDDILNIREVHARAKEGKEDFFYGAGLSNELQAVVDDLVRKDKGVIVGLIEKGEEHLKLAGLVATYDDVQKAWLVKLDQCGMGFFISKAVHTPRHERQKRITLSKLGETLKNNDHGTGRRKIILGRDVVA